MSAGESSSQESGSRKGKMDVTGIGDTKENQKKQDEEEEEKQEVIK